MNQNVGKNTRILFEEDKYYIYGLCIQLSNENIINYIATEFNSIPDQSCRKLKIFERINLLKWLLERINHYDTYDLEGSFSLRWFNIEIAESQYMNVEMALYFYENLENYQDIQMVGNKTFNLGEMPEISQKSYKEVFKTDILEKNKTDFFSYNSDEQREILNVYHDYKVAYEDEISYPSYSDSEDELFSNAIEKVIRDNMSEKYKTQENINLVDKICLEYIKTKESNIKEEIPSDKIIEIVSNQICINNNLNLTAYYLQYILMSLGVSIPTNKTSFGVSKVSGKQAVILQRLLCAVTTKKWNTVEQKSNTYYKTVYDLFNLDIKDKWEREKLLKHLFKVRTMLVNGGFSEAVGLLDEDCNKIQSIGQ